MTKIIACIDGSPHADSVCELSAWAANKTGLTVTLLHVVAPHSEVAAKSNLSGSIGLNARTDLLKELTEIDEARGKLEQKKGVLILEHATEKLRKKGVDDVESLHLRGSLVETINELKSEAEIIVIGKYGEHASQATEHLGTNLEKVARSTNNKPLLIATKDNNPINNFLIAYDGSESTNKAIDYAISNPLLQGLECHLLMVGESTTENQNLLTNAKSKLENVNFTVHSSIKNQNSVKNTISTYITEHNINLLVIGAYGHSKIRNLILGSTTTTLIHNSNIPVMLFR